MNKRFDSLLPQAEAERNGAERQKTNAFF